MLAGFVILVLTSGADANDNVLCQFSNDYWKYANNRSCEMTTSIIDTDPVRLNSSFIRLGKCNNFVEYYSTCGSNQSQIDIYYCKPYWFQSAGKIKKCDDCDPIEYNAICMGDHQYYIDDPDSRQIILAGYIIFGIMFGLLGLFVLSGCGAIYQIHQDQKRLRSILPVRT